MPDAITVVDLFAGPGGLGEGFSALKAHKEKRAFQIGISVEMESWAHRTLELRSFFRAFEGDVPDEYYQYVRGDPAMTRDELFRRNPAAARAAQDEAMCATLGSEHDEAIYARIEQVLQERDPACWVLIGGPPCQAYSLIGRARHAKVRVETPGKFENDPKHILYREYLKILACFKPAIFVMENVRGMLSSQHEGHAIINQILADLKNPRAAIKEEQHRARWKGDDPAYHVYSLVVPATERDFAPVDFLIRAEDYGVPQARHRVILLGVRDDLATGAGPELLHPFGRTVPVEDVLDGLPGLRSVLSKEPDSPAAWHNALCEGASLALQEVPNTSMQGALPLTEEGMEETLPALIRDAMQVACHRAQTLKRHGAPFVSGDFPAPAHNPCQWYSDPRLGGVCNHVARGHMRSDLHRYLYIAAYGQVKGVSPRMRDLPTNLLPHHKNVGEAGKESIFDDRFRVQVAGRPATTIAAHISKDGHYNIHYDPAQCRSLTVREAARIQTFPDNYFFEGARTDQYRQVGNAVPPYLAYQIARIVYNLLAR